MRIYRLCFFLVFFCLVYTLNAQHTISRVTIPINDRQTSEDIARAGIDLTHGHGKVDDHFTTGLADFELARLDQLGIEYSIDIPDLSQYRKQISQHERGGLLECQDDVSEVTVPRNFELGSIGGFYSMSEVLDQLDIMQFMYPNLISVRKPIGNFKTWQNNSIFWVRISDNPEVDENEPEVLYTGLTHAREFVSVSQMIFYMWHLLENYSKDPLIKQIVDHTELYFIPVINPDGLNYNVQGYDAVEDEFKHYHRKNLRDNDGDGSFNPEYDGVDLNRNFGNHWGYDDIGSSPFTGASTYRGPSPFSEPETKAIQFFCNAHQFKLALNYHSYGNLLVYPSGFNNAHTPDSVTFVNYAQLLTRLNRFVYGLGTETVGYPVNGDSDDYMYGEHHTIAMTPEVGSGDDEFYPARQRIIPLCKSTLEMNILAARVVNSLILVTDESPAFIQPGTNQLKLEFNRYGLLDGEVQISFKAITPNITNVPQALSFNLSEFETHERNLEFHVDDQMVYGSSAQIEIICRQGEYTFRDTITKVRADFSVLIDTDGDLSYWDRSGGLNWGSTASTFKSGPVSIADSPSGTYGPNIMEAILLNEVIDLSNTTSAYAQFWARWDIEDEYDYVVFQASRDGSNWENLCGEWSKPGGVFQLYEEPLYDGKQTQWVLETSDLSAYLGDRIQLRFLIGTDGYVFKDGFYFDDFRVITINEGVSSADDAGKASQVSVFPNPASNSFHLLLPDAGTATVQVYNSIGTCVYSGKTVGQMHEVQSSSWPAGIYHYVIHSGKAVHSTGNICIVR